MTTYTYTSTPEQDAALQRIVDGINATSRPGSPLVTADQHVQALCNHWLNARIQEFREADRIKRDDQYQKLSLTDRAAIDAILTKA